MNTSNRRSERLADKSIMDTVFDTTNNTEEESVKYASHTDADLLDLDNNKKYIVSSRCSKQSTSNNANNDSNNLIDILDQSPAFKVNDYVIFKNSPAIITNIISPDDPFEDDTFVITNNTGISKTVTIDQIQMNNIPWDIVFQIPSVSASLQSTEVSCKSNYTKRSTISSH